MERVSDMGQGDSCNVSTLSMSVHTGTHVDAPSHFVADGRTVDKLLLKVLFGRAYVLHLPDTDLVTAQVLAQAELPPRTRRVLLKTRNSDYWLEEQLDFQSEFVALSSDGAQYLVDRGVQLIGIDYLSVAPFNESERIHQIILGAGVVILEGLDLSRVSEGRYNLYCLPLKLEGLDGAPARAVLIGV